jgi:hypothetical protein
MDCLWRSGSGDCYQQPCRQQLASPILIMNTGRLCRLVVGRLLQSEGARWHDQLGRAAWCREQQMHDRIIENRLLKTARLAS